MPAFAAAQPCFHKMINLTAVRDGPPLPNPWRVHQLAKALIIRGSPHAQRCIAQPALRIWAMSFPMGRRRRACGIV